MELTLPSLFLYFLIEARATDVGEYCGIFVRSSPAGGIRSIYQYSNIAPRLSGQNCNFFKFLLSLNSQKRLGYKENNAKFRSLS